MKCRQMGWFTHAGRVQVAGQAGRVCPWEAHIWTGQGIQMKLPIGLSLINFMKFRCISCSQLMSWVPSLHVSLSLTPSSYLLPIEYLYFDYFLMIFSLPIIDFDYLCWVSFFKAVVFNTTGWLNIIYLFLLNFNISLLVFIFYVV